MQSREWKEREETEFEICKLECQAERKGKMFHQIVMELF